jgi:hypothetical protein
LSLWARRLVGEAISQSQHVLAQRAPLMELFVAGLNDFSGVSQLTARIVARHEVRMQELGLKS